jgi:hypothetical protein
MMALEMVLELLASAGPDLSFDVDGSEVDVRVQDFMGFDEDWMEVSRPLVDEDLVDAIEAQLEESALSVSGDYYRYFEFDGFSVCWGYASFDI